MVERVVLEAQVAVALGLTALQQERRELPTRAAVEAEVVTRLVVLALLVALAVLVSSLFE